jgi:hypothetical protein
MTVACCPHGDEYGSPHHMTQGGRIPAEPPVREPSEQSNEEDVMKKELAFRESNGVAVTLYWHSGTNRVSVTVFDAFNDELFELDADPSEALDLFDHPYAHAARRGSFPVAAAEPVAA